MTTPEIEELKSLVEQKYGKILATTTDFEEFSLYLEKKASGTISPSTLKRLYGYVSDNHKPRMVTLDILSQAEISKAKPRKTANRNSIIFFFILLLSCTEFRHIFIIISNDFFQD